jgi:hypothetical protein
MTMLKTGRMNEIAYEMQKNKKQNTNTNKESDKPIKNKYTLYYSCNPERAGQ